MGYFYFLVMFYNFRFWDLRLEVQWIIVGVSEDSPDFRVMLVAVFPVRGRG